MTTYDFCLGDHVRDMNILTKLSDMINLRKQNIFMVSCNVLGTGWAYEQNFSGFSDKYCKIGNLCDFCRYHDICRSFLHTYIAKYRVCNFFLLQNSRALAVPWLRFDQQLLVTVVSEPPTFANFSYHKAFLSTVKREWNGYHTKRYKTTPIF